MRLQAVHDRFERHGVDQWAACTVGAPPEASCQHHWELTPEGYTDVFKALRRAAGPGATEVVDLGAGCGLGVAHAVASGIFKRARGVEAVPARVAAAQAALRDLGLVQRASVAQASFADAGFAVAAPCALCCDVAFNRATLAAAARAMEASPACRALVSFKPPSRWAAAGLASFELARSARVRTNGGERFTYFVYRRGGREVASPP
jgi:hypothetical protein